jgi:hypothetical protein
MGTSIFCMETPQKDTPLLPLFTATLFPESFLLPAFTARHKIPSSSHLSKPYKRALPLSPHFCSRKLLPRLQAVFPDG